MTAPVQRCVSTLNRSLSFSSGVVKRLTTDHRHAPLTCHSSSAYQESAKAIPTNMGIQDNSIIRAYYYYHTSVSQSTGPAKNFSRVNRPVFNFSLLPSPFFVSTRGRCQESKHATRQSAKEEEEKKQPPNSMQFSVPFWKKKIFRFIFICQSKVFLLDCSRSQNTRMDDTS